MPGQFRPRGVMMRDCSKNRAGFDRVLMAVAATFLTVSATSALAQADPARNSAAELAIDAAIPRPEPANVPPPTVNDFKLDTHRAAYPTREADAAKAAETKPSDVVTAPAADTSKADADKADTDQGRHRQGRHRQDRHGDHHDRRRRPRRPQRRPPSPPRNRSRPPATSRPADQPVADKLRDMLGAKVAALFRPQGRTDRGREILHRARLCAAVDAGRHADRDRQGRHRAAEGCRLRRPQSPPIIRCRISPPRPIPMRWRKPI